MSGQMADAWITLAATGQPVHHHGRHYTVDGIQFLRRPVPQPGVPVWAAGFPGDVKPLHPATVSLDQVRGVLRDGPATL